jgi:hypothetical protein
LVLASLLLLVSLLLLGQAVVNIPSLTDVTTVPCVFFLLLVSTAAVGRAFPAVLVFPSAAVRLAVDVFLVLLFRHLSLISVPMHSKCYQ